MGNIKCMCPSCSTIFELASEFAGQKAECSSCQTKFLVPEAPSPQPQPEHPQDSTPNSPTPPPEKGGGNRLLLIVALLIVSAVVYIILDQNSQPEPVDVPSEEAGNKIDEEGAKPEINELIKVRNVTKVPVVVKDDVEVLVKIDEDNPLDFTQWQGSYGKKVEIKDWVKRNPNPWCSYQSADSEDCAKRWYIVLGPLGVRTLMHDISWSPKKGFKAIFPKALCDSNGLLFNNMEILDVQNTSPAAGHLKTGDLILKIDDVALKTATALQLDKPIDKLSVRGLEFHAGQLIDAAEGRGKIKLTVLRIPEAIRNSSVKHLARKWQLHKSQKLTSPLKFSIPLEAGTYARINLGVDPKWLRRNGVKFDVTLSNGSKSIKISASQEQFKVPPGNWTLAGTVTAQKGRNFCKIESIKAPVIPADLKRYVKNIEFSLPRFGSFGKVYNPTSPKAVNSAKAMAHALAAQQLPNGAWPRVKAYTSQSFYTSMSALALMSTGDSQYDSHVRKAAHYVAYNDDRLDKWSYVRGTNLIFLGEYYLKTRDAYIEPAMKRWVALNRACVLADYTAGHGEGGPGYGGSGYIGGGSVICCGLALVDKCGLLSDDDKLVLEKMLERVQQLAPNGKVPYGRMGARTVQVAGQHGGGCGTGAYFSASLIHGGAKHFVEATSKRYTTAPYGSSECGHATQTLHFFWSSIAIFNSSLSAHIDNMSAYIWKFTTHRTFDGFANNNNSAVEYHNGDGIVGPPFWRTASFVILLNAHKRNLAISGKPEHMRKTLKDYPIVFFGDRAAQNYILRSWQIVDAFLGKKAPAKFTSALKKIQSLTDGQNLGPNLFQLLNKELPAVAKSIKAMSWDDKRISKNQILRLIHGITFESASIVKPAEKSKSKSDKKANKKAEKKRAKDIASGKIKEKIDYIIQITPVSLVSMMASRAGLESPAFPALEAQGTVTCIDPTKKYLKSPFKFEFNTKKEVATSKGAAKKQKAQSAKQRLISLSPAEKAILKVKFDYKINGIQMSYTEDMPMPTPVARGYIPNLCKIWVPGTVIEDYVGQYAFRVRLENGAVIGCEKRTFKAPVNYILAGTPCEFLISPDSVWGHAVQDVRVLNPKHRAVPKPEIRISGEKVKGDVATIADHNLKTGINLLYSKPELNFTIEQTFANPVYVDSVLPQWETSSKNPKNAKLFFDIEAQVDGQWKLLGKGQGQSLTKFAPTTTKKFRFKVRTQKLSGLKLNEFHLNKVYKPGVLKATW